MNTRRVRHKLRVRRMTIARWCTPYFLALLGLVGLVLALQLLLAGTGLLNTGVSCRAICGLTLLVTLVGGEQVGAIVGSALWAIAGLVCLRFAWGSR